MTSKWTCTWNNHKTKGEAWGAVSLQLNDLFRPCPMTTLNFDHLVSCYCLIYVTKYRLKLYNDVCKGAFSDIVGNENLYGGKPLDPSRLVALLSYEGWLRHWFENLKFDFIAKQMNIPFFVVNISLPSRWSTYSGSSTFKIIRFNSRWVI